MPEGMSECDMTVESGRIDFDIHIERATMCCSSPDSRDSLVGFARLHRRIRMFSNLVWKSISGPSSRQSSEVTSILEDVILSTTSLWSCNNV